MNGQTRASKKKWDLRISSIDAVNKNRARYWKSGMIFSKYSGYENESKLEEVYALSFSPRSREAYAYCRGQIHIKSLEGSICDTSQD